MEMVDFLKRNILDSVNHKGYDQNGLQYLMKCKKDIQDLNVFLDRNINAIKKTI